jgi:hypothetical protein
VEPDCLRWQAQVQDVAEDNVTQFAKGLLYDRSPMSADQFFQDAKVYSPYSETMYKDSRLLVAATEVANVPEGECLRSRDGSAAWHLDLTAAPSV